jgi:hypothetical protein
MFVLTVSILQNPTDSTKSKPLTSWGATLRKNARRLIGSRRERRLIGYIPAAHRLSISKALHQRWFIPYPQELRPTHDTEHPTKYPILPLALAATSSETAGIVGDAHRRNFWKC